MDRQDQGLTGAKTRLALALAGGALIAGACLHSSTHTVAEMHIRLAPLRPATRTVQVKARHHRRNLLAGLASWYGEVLEGHTTASGEVFHKDMLTACHPTLPFGTLVRVVNLRNRKSVVVKINDRGQLNPGRVIDLSSAAADRIGMLRAGLAPVRLEIVRARG